MTPRMSNAFCKLNLGLVSTGKILLGNTVKKQRTTVGPVGES